MTLSTPRQPRRASTWLTVAGYRIGLALLLALSSPAARPAAAGQQAKPGAPDNTIAPSALAQMNALIVDKMARSPVQQKMDSNLIYGARIVSGRPIVNGLPTVQIYLPMSADNRVLLDVRAKVSDALLTQLRAIGAEVTYSNARYEHVAVKAPLGIVETIAGMADVEHVAPEYGWMTSNTMAPGMRLVTGPLSQPVPAQMAKDARADTLAALRAAIQHRAAFRQQGGILNIGPVTSQGDATHRAAEARSTFGVNGSGVKIGVLSDGVNTLATSQSHGELPAVTVLSGQAGSGDEGTAMLEIVADLAPGAQLYFATAGSSTAQFAQNIRDLRTAGCDIIVDDVSFFVESPFQDGQTGTSTYNSGVIAQAVKDVAAGGALYFSSAANSGRTDAGTSGTWEGDFVDGGVAGGVLVGGGNLHNFGSALSDTVTTTGGNINTLFWSDPLGGSSNDYDLYLLNSAGTAIVAFGNTTQSGTQDPFEYAGAASNGQRLVITKYSGVARFLHLATNRGVLAIATSGETHGHAATSAANTYGVAATPACAGAGSTGPCTTTFVGTNLTETFSSDGLRRIFFTGAGAAITPGNFSSTGGTVLNKPDITAADGVSTSVAGFTSFFGTSAAAPHAAAIAALVKSRNLSRTATQVSSALTSTAIDIHAAGFDRNSGYGIIMAYQAISVVPAGSSPPAITLNPPSTTTVLSGNVIFFSTSASGSPAPTAQWQVSTSGGASWSNIAGATSPNLSFAAQRADNGKQYRVVYTNSGGTATTTAAALFVRLRVSTDLDADRKSELMVWRPGTGFWYWLYSASSYLVSSAGQKQWGTNSLGDVPLSGDIDGDGRMDLVVWRASTGTWYWLTAASGYDYAAQGQKQWGNLGLGDVPMLGDVDGDGKADLIVWRASTGTWFWLTSSSGYNYTFAGQKQWGSQGLGDQPMIGDFDGDGLADLAVWRASTGTWFWLTSSSGYDYAASGQKQWGNSSLGDKPLIGDMDGDGITDLTIWRTSDSTFYWLTSVNGYNYAAQGQKQWGSGAQGDIPMLGNVDSDGVADLIVWRPGTGTWFWLTSSTSYNLASQGQKQWGTAGDVPMIK